MAETLEPPWQERKLRYSEIIRHATPEIRRVSLANKWLQFGRDRQQTLWFYTSAFEQSVLDLGKATRREGNSSWKRILIKERSAQHKISHDGG